MALLVVSPGADVARTGNRCTAAQWKTMLEAWGFTVQVAENHVSQQAPVLIALNAAKSHDSILSYREVNPDGKIVVALTGTDIYPEPGDAALESIRLADRVIALQENARDQVPATDRHKVEVIVQSASPRGQRGTPSSDYFSVCVVGHIRSVKDPLLTARATRLLPGSSRIRVFHAGGIIDPAFREAVEREQQENPRYEWLGELSGEDTASLIADSSLLVLTSRSEGGARVVGEAIVEGTPVLSSRIDGVIGLLGPDYPGFFPPGDAEALAALLERAETDPPYYRALLDETRRLAPLFSPEREKTALCRLVGGLGQENPVGSLS